MNSVDLDKYHTDTFSLVRTMVIKIEALAERDNLVLTDAGYSVSSDKTTWRYYMNLNGDYHPNDEIMWINSIDTGERIVFNKENLKLHLATNREYSKGGYWFNRLADEYQSQIVLINGILSPIPYSETIEAKDYKILRYNKSLVLWNEEQLIPKLQEFVNSDVIHSMKNDYVTTDDLFLTWMLEKLYAHLLGAIHAIRLEYCYTRHTHEFFVWSHIDSFGEFSQYKRSLSKEQTMWLFRNIAWVRNNPGQQYTFDKLMKNLLTKANIPLARFDMVSSTETQLEDLTPTPLYRRMQMNLVDVYGRTASFIDTQAMITKQQVMAKENYDQTDFYLDDALVKGKYSLHSELPTKALESSMMDYTNRHIDTLMKVVYNEWIYLAGNKIFNGKVITVDPKSGKQYRLPVGDAYYIWKYLVEYAKGKSPLVIEPAYYQNVLKLKPPTIDEIIEIGGPDFIRPYVAADIQKLWFPVAPFLAPDYLIQYATEVYGTMWKHKKLYSQFYDLNKRARVKNSCKLMYDSGIVNLTEYGDFDSLLKTYELDFTDYTAEEARNFSWDIFKRVTGWDTNATPSTRVKQSDLIDIMSELSSYTIHIVKDINDGTDQTELVNETFVGDSRWVGVGNGSYGDFKNVMITQHSNMDSIHALEANIPIISNPDPVLVADSEMKIDIITHDIFKPVNLTNNLADYAIKLYDNSYLRMLPDGALAPLVIPPTYYGELEPEDGYTIPGTYYGLLSPEEDPVVPAKVIPRTYYGGLKPNGDL